jgi:hypothetical protein
MTLVACPSTGPVAPGTRPRRQAPDGSGGLSSVPASCCWPRGPARLGHGRGPPGHSCRRGRRARRVRGDASADDRVPASGRLGLYARLSGVSTADPSAGVSVLDFGGGDVSVPVCFGDPVLVEDWGAAVVPSAAVVGPRRHAAWLRLGGRADQVNVSFFPGAAGAFVGVPMPELVNRMAPPDDVWPHDFREAVAALQPLPTGQRICGLADLLLARLEPCREPPRRVPGRGHADTADFGRRRVRECQAAT